MNNNNYSNNSGMGNRSGGNSGMDQSGMSGGGMNRNDGINRTGSNLRPAGNSPATGNGFTVPSGIGYDAYQGSIQQILRDNIGQFVDVEFLIGTGSLVTRSGILNTVGVSYIVLYEAAQDRYMICDLYSIKFVTIYDPNR